MCVSTLPHSVIDLHEAIFVDGITIGRALQSASSWWKGHLVQP